MMRESDEENYAGMESKESAADNIILFPDFERLKKEAEKMRIELSMLMLEKDELQFVICKNIEAEYILKLGGLEYKAYETMCAAMRLKRKAELIQARKNRQEKIIISDIERILDTEFEEYRNTLDDLTDRINEAVDRKNAAVLSDEENREIKKLYRKIVKALHPDINPDASEGQLRLFENAVSAYKSGDLETIRLISEMVDGELPPKHSDDAMTQLVREKERLSSLLKAIRDSIERIKSEYPYTLLEILADSEKFEQKKRELENSIEQYSEQIAVYKSKIMEMLR